MAEYCADCAKIYGMENDFDGLCKADEITCVLCEGCGGMIWVDHKGKRQYEPLGDDQIQI